MAFLQAKLNWNTISCPVGANRTVGGVKASTTQAIKVLELRATHDGNVSGNAPDLTSFARCTFGANGPGTNSTLYTLVKKDTARAEGSGSNPNTTGATGWTVEPTTQTMDEVYNLPQYNGAYHYILPFAAPLIVVGGQGYVVGHNSPNTVNSCGKIEIEE